jgi:hypothetical protein
MRCAIFAFVPGVRWGMSIFSTAASSADRIVRTNLISNVMNHPALSNAIEFLPPNEVARMTKKTRYCFCDFADRPLN